VLGAFLDYMLMGWIDIHYFVRRVVLTVPPRRYLLSSLDVLPDEV
jgi:hypothetical protein